MRDRFLLPTTGSPGIRAHSRRLTLTALAGLGTLALAASPDSVQAQDETALEPVKVTTTRTNQGRSLSEIPGSVSIIDGEDLEKQTRTTQDMGEVLSNLVPGMGQSSENLTNFGQQMRGRSFLVMIDGVPQNAVLRQAFKHLRSISSEAIERVEVVRGAVATYGIGATGGIINFITKSGQGSDDPVFQTTAALNGQEENSDSLGGRIYQGARGDTGIFDYSINLAAEQTGSWYDGDDDLIPPDGFSSQGGGLAESNEFNFQTKLGYEPGDDQRLQFSINYYDHKQDADNIADTATGNPDTDEATQALDQEPGGEDTGTENLNISLDHTLRNFLGGTLSTQAYYQDYETLFGFSNFFQTGPGQTFLETEHVGARAVHERSFGSVEASYGLDLGRETTAQNFRDGRTNAGEHEQFNYAPFVQLQLPLSDAWLIKGGVRHEQVKVDISTFRNQSVPNPGTITGGDLDYDETVFNLGAVYSLSAAQEIFAGFSQGFSVADIVRALRARSQNGLDVNAERFEPEAQVVDNFELGWRGRFERLQASAVAFYNTTDEGTTFGGPPNFPLQRQEEEILGVELSADADVTERITIGGTGSWQEGEKDTNNDGRLDEDLPGTRIAAPEVTAYTEYEGTGDWSARAQLKHLFGRDKFDSAALGPAQAFGKGEVDGYSLLNLSARAAAGPGHLRLGVRNVLDEQYITPLGQTFNLTGFVVAGKGRSFHAGYTVKY